MSNRIQFGEPIQPVIPDEALPPGSLLIGSAQRPRSDSFQVYMLQDVYAKIWSHVSQTPDIESGGVLVGHPFRTFDGQTTFVIITAAIPQHTPDRSAGHFTVGPTQIAEARREMQLRYPGLIVVGWYHSHPAHGVFLSGQDMTIVSNIYDAPWHIAMVVDPIRHTEGIFVGPEGQQIGGHGDLPPKTGWTGIREVPDCIKAIALYNQMRDRLEEKRMEEAHNILHQLQALTERSSQLKHWRDRGEYRDLTTFQSKLGQTFSSPSSTPDVQTVPPQVEPLVVRTAPPRSGPPEPARGSGKGRSPINWLTLSTISTIGFAILSLVIAFLDKEWPYWVTLIWGILLSFLALILAGYVVFSRKEIEFSHRPHFAGERIIALFLVGLVLILWVSYGVFSTKMRTPINTPTLLASPTLIVSQTSTPTTLPPAATATATATSTQTPTSTPTSPPTDTPTPSPTTTDTLTPTYTPTWTPTATSTITTPTLTATTIPTPTIAITPTNPITP